MLKLKTLIVEDEVSGRRRDCGELGGSPGSKLPLNGNGLTYSSDEGGLALRFSEGAASRTVDAARSISSFRIVESDVFSSISTSGASPSKSTGAATMSITGSGCCGSSAEGRTLALDRADEDDKREAASNLKDELTLEAGETYSLRNSSYMQNTRLTFL